MITIPSNYDSTTYIHRSDQSRMKLRLRGELIEFTRIDRYGHATDAVILTLAEAEKMSDKLALLCRQARGIDRHH